MKHRQQLPSGPCAERPRRSVTSRVAMTAVVALGFGALAVPYDAAPAAAAAATVGNGLTTTDLATVGMSPTALATALVGDGVTVSNVTYSGSPAQAGTIHLLDPAVVSFNDGIILSSGDIADVVGPNKSDGITGDMAGPADADLNALVQGTQTVNPWTYDAASLEFDFVPTADTVYFTYTFGSDEYLEWVNLFNDVFAFYVNGTNCATVPGGSPISIDTINSAVNPNLFRDNSYAEPPANPINIESDGLSVEMICAAPVNAGQTNHMKLVIADTSDQILDSVVMIKAQSLSTTKPESCNDSVDNDDDLLVDMDDDSCALTTTPPPTGSGGVGSSGSAPPFTGNEGTPIVLDASTLGWFATPEALTTTWTVTGINGTVGTCEITPPGPLPVGSGDAIAPVTTICPTDGEYVARVDGTDVEGHSAFDYDVDFFVHNAPPSVTIDGPASGTQVVVGVPVDLTATVVDPGVNDSVSCEISWGDGATGAGVLVDSSCTGTHTYAAVGSQVVTVTGTDDDAASSAAAIVVHVTDDGGPTNTPPAADAGGPYTGTEGSPVVLSGSAFDADGDPIVTEWTVVPTAGAAPGTACVVADASALVTTFTCDDDAAVDVTLLASDGQDGGADATTATVANVPPTATFVAPGADSTVVAGNPLAVIAAIADAGSHDVLVCSIAWGDGSDDTVGDIAGGECTAHHVYAGVGSSTVGVTVVDDDGGAVVATQLINVVAPAPSIGGFAPAAGGIGTTVTITGSGLLGATSVTFGGTAATFTVASSTTITAIVPIGAPTGKVAVTTAGGIAISSGTFTVVPAPAVTRLSPTSGPVGTKVTITGKRLTGASAVTFGGTAAPFTVVSATKIMATVPAGATTGKVSVTTAGGTAVSAATFTVRPPTIVGLNRSSGPVGTVVTVTGKGFVEVAAVTFGGTAAVTFTVVSATKITVIVPAGAGTGKVAVVTAGGTATSTRTFTVR